MIAGIIPARYKSSRFPGKPLADICGKPMIFRVWEAVSKCECLDDVYVATDDEKIKEVCDYFRIKVVMTSDSCKTGTDRVAEACLKINADYVINIQGDEPLIDPSNISLVVDNLKTGHDIVNVMCPITAYVDVINPTIPKVVANKNNILVYMSRGPIPFPKSPLAFSGTYYKQQGLYGFTKAALRAFASLEEGYLESVEGVEILRFIENGFQVKMIEVSKPSISVDVPDDLIIVQREFIKIHGEIR